MRYRIRLFIFGMLALGVIACTIVDVVRELDPASAASQQHRYMQQLRSTAN